MSSWKMSFIIIWNVAVLLVRPKNMTRGLNKPWFSCHPLISFPNTYIVVSPSDIQLGEIFFLGFRHAVEDVWDQGQRVGVLYGHHIELSIILDRQKLPSFFMMKKTGDAICNLDGHIFQLLTSHPGNDPTAPVQPWLGGRSWYWIPHSLVQVQWCGPISSNPGGNLKILWKRSPWTPGRVWVLCLLKHVEHASPAPLANLWDMVWAALTSSSSWSMKC